eukprot:3979194-Amphidinium_carterae.1
MASPSLARIRDAKLSLGVSATAFLATARQQQISPQVPSMSIGMFTCPRAYRIKRTSLSPEAMRPMSIAEDVDV